jgi:drug/metabolite transporter (DMT)-like permease
VSATAARLQVLAAAILFSTGGAAIKIDVFSAAQTSCLRSGIAAVTLLLWLRSRLQWSWSIAAAAVAYAGILSLFVAATKLTTAANAILLQATAPLYLLVLGPLVLHERFHRRDLAFLGAMALGLVLCVAGRPPDSATAPNPMLGNVLGAASGFVWALTLLALRYLGRDDRTGAAPVSAVVIGNLLACAVALPWAVPLPEASAGAWATIVYLGVFQIGLAYFLLSSAFGRLPALETSLLLLLEPVLNPVWAWLVHGEDPGSWTIFGGAVILGATVIKTIHDTRTGKP